MTRFDEKKLVLLRKLGDHLKAQREHVFHETPAEFALRLELFGATVNGSDVEAMECGDASISIGSWLSAWMAMQVADGVADASRSDAALFLAATKHQPGVEQEIARFMAKKGE